MEVEHLSYIFGSFARKRQSQDVSNTKKSSNHPIRISHDRSKSAPHKSKSIETPLPRAKSICSYDADNAKFKCSFCRNVFTEPRVLPCLHTFCTTCLRQLTNNSRGLQVSLRRDGAYFQKTTSTSTGSCDDIDGESTTNTIICPNCSASFELSRNGIEEFPPNYLLQHRMVLATLNSRATKLLCDLCIDNITAKFRCSECAISLCQGCADNHRHQPSNLHHDVLTLDEARRRGITKVRRQIMCFNHSENELSMFCASCCKVICRECFSQKHRNHVNESIPRATMYHRNNLNLALNKARAIAERTSNAVSKLQETSDRIEAHCENVQEEVDLFIQSYMEALQQHRKKLQKEVNENRIEKLHRIDQHGIDLHKRLKEIGDALVFAEELISEGTDIEILSFVKPIMKRLEICNQKSVPELHASTSLLFLPYETSSETWNSCPLYGVITKQTVAPDHCVISQEGLQNLRVGKRAEIILELRDKTDTPLQWGGEIVSAEVKHKDSGPRKQLILQTEDKKNGTYNIYFIPSVAGKYTLFVNVKSQPIKDNPFIFTVRPFRPHHGSFHCCSFCSSGGSKDALCGCGGKMPGGYKGCGHGHEGHPGKRHWSCCGNTLEHSECNKRNSTHYQFTL